MSKDIEKAIQSLIDGMLAEQDRVALNELLRSHAGARAEFAAQMKLHALLKWRAGNAVAQVPTVRRRIPPQTWRWTGWATAASLVLGFTLLVVSPKPAAAAVSQIIAAWERAQDRTYAITVLEGDKWQPLRDGRQVGYEGAKLHLRGQSQFVLVRKLDRGGDVVTGSDGQSNWDIRGKGPVRVSADTGRFRGGIPGEHQNVPFHDLKGLLHSLAADYNLTLSQDDSAPGTQRLRANKRNRDQRGLPRMEFLFNKGTGTVVWMELHGLPRERGGPRAVRLTLTSESAFPADFFTHDAHHDPRRQVIREPADLKP